MSEWEHFKYVLENVLPSYKHFSTLSCNIEFNSYYYYEYSWRLTIKRCEVYDEIKTLSEFCGINWERMFFDHESISLELYEDRKIPTKPVYW
jgi:hypothetical protein